MYGMAKEGTLPRVFARTHLSRRTPGVAIVFTTLVALFLIVAVGEEGSGRWRTRRWRFCSPCSRLCAFAR